ncbi:MAG: helix-turn-helix domain-containing protein, partial [Candidatus Yonathbacteria bacterium]|nr:helix-turn-helix domain-containing protein [Candidatus Yonathbacteria bacterium]
MHKKKNHKGGKPFSLRERSIIEVRWCRDSKSITDIAEELKRHKSSISREVSGKPRKGRGKYNADAAHRKAIERISNRGNIPKTAKNKLL